MSSPAAAYDHESSSFWDPRALDQELRRVATVCNGCRLCFDLCPSFPHLFQRTDGLEADYDKAHGHTGVPTLSAEEAEHIPHEGEDLGIKLGEAKISTKNPVELLSQQDLRTVVDLCYNCKLCYPKCPYVPPHEFMIDFPRLMLRAKMVKARQEGVTMQDRFLGAVDAVGSVMTQVAGLANWAQHSRFNRMLMEKTVGIHRDRDLPPWASETFISWWKRQQREGPKPTGPKVLLFYTCFANYNDPDLGQAAVEVLEKQGCDIAIPEQKCCGMPLLDGGDLERTLENARHNVELLLPYVREGRKVLSPGPTCTFMLKQEYPELLKTSEAKEVAEAVMDLGDFLLSLKKEGKLNLDFKAKVGTVAYHVPCHNKVQNLGFRGRDLLKAAGAEVKMVDRCCGMDGTWGMKKEFFPISLKVAGAAIQMVKEQDPQVVVSDCPLAGVQLTQGTGRKTLHPVKVLRAAYRGETAGDGPKKKEGEP